MAKLAELPDSLDPALAEALEAPGSIALPHQAEAYETARRSHLILTSGTASGKSLSFNLPVLDGIAREPLRRAFYLYPTKALAQDQARKLGELRPPGCARRSTTATRRARIGLRSAAAPTWS